MIHKYGIFILHRGYGNSAVAPNNYCEVWARHGPDQTQFGKLLEPPCIRHDILPRAGAWYIHRGRYFSKLSGALMISASISRDRQMLAWQGTSLLGIFPFATKKYILG
jgi:hypothetical protein